MYRIGSFWRSGIDGAPDLREAIRWFRRSAMNGSGAAQLNLGRALRSGKGTEIDLLRAWAWLRIAADRGVADAQKELPAFESELTPAQIEEGTRITKRLRGLIDANMARAPAPAGP
jgi:TPR repeat protein